MITDYQIRNVLRVYGNQLKKRSLPEERLADQMPAHDMDSIDVSLEERRNQVLNGIPHHLLSQIDLDRNKEKM